MSLRRLDKWTKGELSEFTKWSIDNLVSPPMSLYAIGDKAIEIASRKRAFRIIEDPAKLSKMIAAGEEYLLKSDILLWFAHCGHSVTVQDETFYLLLDTTMHIIPDYCVEPYSKEEMND